jgi:hypothetical protein
MTNAVRVASHTTEARGSEEPKRANGVAHRKTCHQ